MRTSYGLPYRGSKNQIAKWIVGLLPPAPVLVDLFCGGCAVTDCALQTDKWGRVIANDADALMPQFYLDAVRGFYEDRRNKWVSSEEFHRMKHTDAFISCVWSFGFNRMEYCSKKHEAEAHEDFLKTGRVFWRNVIARVLSLHTPSRMANIRKLTTSGCDYRDVEIPDGAIIYCDIPYRKAFHQYPHRFRHETFYDWAAACPHPVYISERNMPEPFCLVGETTRGQGICAQKNERVTERIFANQIGKDLINARL